MTRLEDGGRVVLFAEGTSSDGNRVLPYKSSLFASAKPRRATSREGVCVQTVAVAYTHLHGLPLGRTWRPLVAWYGEMEMAGHVWELLTRGPLDVHVRIGAPIALDRFADRKALARHSEEEVRAGVSELLTAGRARTRPGREAARMEDEDQVKAA